jgi:hypothetical protein
MCLKISKDQRIGLFKWLGGFSKEPSRAWKWNTQLCSKKNLDDWVKHTLNRDGERISKTEILSRGNYLKWRPGKKEGEVLKACAEFSEKIWGIFNLSASRKFKDWVERRVLWLFCFWDRLSISSPVYLCLAWRSSCLSLLSSEITEVSYDTWLENTCFLRDND